MGAVHPRNVARKIKEQAEMTDLLHNSLKGIFLFTKYHELLDSLRTDQDSSGPVRGKTLNFKRDCAHRIARVSRWLSDLD